MSRDGCNRHWHGQATTSYCNFRGLRRYSPMNFTIMLIDPTIMRLTPTGFPTIPHTDLASYLCTCSWIQPHGPRSVEFPYARQDSPIVCVRVDASDTNGAQTPRPDSFRTKRSFLSRRSCRCLFRKSCCLRHEPFPHRLAIAGFRPSTQ